MQEAFVLIGTVSGKGAEVVRVLRLLGKEGVVRADVVTGPYDVIVLVQGSDPNSIGRLVLDKIRPHGDGLGISGIIKTMTCLVCDY